MKQSGFTLLEIMVVVFLIALTVGIVSINFRHDKSQLVEVEARRFVALVEQMCQESVVQGRVLAVTNKGATAYHFLVFENGGWQEITKDDIFRLRQLTEDISLNLDIDEGRVSKDKSYLRCEPDGFMTPFSAVFDLDGIRYRVLTNELRKMEIKATE
jgi:general secretion pathway protein H